jgi:Arylsulfotransferase (ASST)/Secretion system C-terminal sorting domain
MRQLISCLGLLILSFQNLSAQTVGLISTSENSAEGYVLFAPIMSTQTYLIDKCGRLVHEWTSTYKPGQSCYLLENGLLLRTGNSDNNEFTAGGTGGVIELIDWNSAVVWSYTISNTSECQHHDVCPLPNGHILAISWEAHTSDDAISNGRDPSLTPDQVWSEKVLELEPVGTSSANIVWEWHVWDHMIQEFDPTKPSYGVVADHPELIHTNYSVTATNSDWLHINAIDYNAALDQVLLSVHNFNEVWIIDHSTTTSESASHVGGNSSHGGDLLYRWGNPFAYNRGVLGSKKFFGQHNAQWIENGLAGAGSILVFNNGANRPQGNYSSVEIFTPSLSNGQYQIAATGPILPTSSDWIYTATPATSFFANNISGAQRLANGNTLICDGPSGRLFEIDPINAITWEYVNPVGSTGIASQGSTAINNLTFRCSLYPSDYLGFSGQDMTPGDPIELNPIAQSCITSNVEKELEKTLNVFPNPFEDNFSVDFIGRKPSLQIFDVCGKALTFETTAAEGRIDVVLKSNVPSGVYYLEIIAEKGVEVIRLLKQ